MWTSLHNCPITTLVKFLSLSIKRTAKTWACNIGLYQRPVTSACINGLCHETIESLWFVDVNGTAKYTRVSIRVMVFNPTFNNISVIAWRSVLLVEETGVPRENHRPVASHWQTLSYNVVSSTPRHERDTNSQRYWW